MTDEQRLREAYSHWNETRGSDTSKWLELMSENVVFRSLAGGAPGMEFTKKCNSKKDVEGYFGGLQEDWEMIYYVPDIFIVDEERIAVLAKCSFKSKRTGKIVETPKADFFIFKNHKIVEFYEFYDTAKAFAASIPD